MTRSNSPRPRAASSFILRALLLALAATVALAPLPAAAQAADNSMAQGTDQAKDQSQSQDKKKDQETAAEKEKAEETPTVGETIVVTARKRKEDVQKVPVAVTVQSGEQLEEAGAQDISELQEDVPNLSIYSGRNQSTTLTVFLRGIGQADPLWGVDPGVGLYFDDVYIARPQGALLDVFDVQRIEVLRGPQGTLYGKNTIGGAIRYVSKPLTDALEGKIAITPGSYSNQDVTASVGGALVPGKLRARIALASLKHDGYGTNLFTGTDVSDKDTQAGRISLEWLPTDDLTFQLSYDKTRDDSNPKGLTRLAANPFCPLFLGQACPPLAHHFDTQSGLAPLNGTDSSGSAMHIEWRANPAWTFKSISSYRETSSENNIDFDTTPAPIADVAATYYDHQATQEFQALFDNGGRLNGVLGAYYFNGTAGGRVLNNFLNLLFGSTEGSVGTESYALFGEGNYSLTPKLTLTLGLRATKEKKHGIAYNVGFTDATFTTINAVTADFDKEKTFDSLSPKVSLSYQFNPNVMGYVTGTRGFKSGGYNVRAQATAFPRSAEPFKDEVLTVGEAGIKSVLLDRSLRFNVATFYGDYTDIQVSTFTAYDSNGDGVENAFFGDFLNAGDATVKGVETEWDWAPQALSWFGISGNLSYLDAKPTKFLDLNDDGFVDTQVITNAPKFTGTLRLNFDHTLWGGLFTASAGVSHRDESTLTNEGGPDPSNPTQALQPIIQPAYETYDAWVSWLSADAKWRVGVVGRNLSDEGYLTNGYNIPVLGILQGSYGAPRTVLTTLEYRF